AAVGGEELTSRVVGRPAAGLWGQDIGPRSGRCRRPRDRGAAGLTGSCSHPTTAIGWKERCLHSPPRSPGGAPETHESPRTRGGRGPPCSAALFPGSPPWP